jgi:hypothetical protein
MSGNRGDAGSRHCLAVIDGLILTEDAFRQGSSALAPGKRAIEICDLIRMADANAKGL